MEAKRVCLAAVGDALAADGSGRRLESQIRQSAIGFERYRITKLAI